MKAFTELETNELINLAVEYTKDGKPLTEAFSRFAGKSGKAVGSVRNHYYKNVKSNFSKLNLPERMRPALIIEFTRQEELSLLTHVIKGVTSGKSVRKCVYDLASGNEKLALRYLNKYRTLLKVNSPLILEAESIVKQELGHVKSVKVGVYNHSQKFQKLEREINEMLDRLLKEVVAENNSLKAESHALQLENERLKNVVRETMRQKNFTKDYFARQIMENAK